MNNIKIKNDDELSLRLGKCGIGCNYLIKITVDFSRYLNGLKYTIGIGRKGSLVSKRKRNELEKNQPLCTVHQAGFR